MERNLTMMTDLYQLTMMNGYFVNGTYKNTAVFDVFFRQKGQMNYAVSAGLTQAVDYINNLRFDKADIEYLRSLKQFDDGFLDYLSNFKFTGDMYSVVEGELVFPYEPTLIVRAPIIEAQFIETALLNIVNHQTLIATKASRIVKAAAGKKVVEFGLRRAQGPDAGIYGARASMIGGCSGTSNVLAGQMFDIPVLGTHAHSWIMSFSDEYEAFKAYADLYPGACILLVDTYDTLKSGVPNAIRVFREMREAGIPLTYYGIRMDSGDLAYLSKKVRRMLDEADFPDAVISASNDLDEYLIESLKLQGATITSWGVGTNLITSKDNPAFGGVYKLAAIQDENGSFTPKIKLSENTEKVTNPGNKTVYRIYDNDTGKIRADLICLADETFDPKEDMLLFDPGEPWKKTRIAGESYTLRELLVPVFKNGTCVYESPSTMEIRAICEKEKDTIWDETKRFVNPAKIYVDLSDKLYKLKTEILNEMNQA